MRTVFVLPVLALTLLTAACASGVPGKEGPLGGKAYGPQVSADLQRLVTAENAAVATDGHAATISDLRAGASPFTPTFGIAVTVISVAGPDYCLEGHSVAAPALRYYVDSRIGGVTGNPCT